MAIKLQTGLAEQRMHERRVSVEPVFGNLKQNLGFRRFSLYGLHQVKGEFNLMAIALNLNILFKMMHNNRLAAVIPKSNAIINQHIALSKNILVKFCSNSTTLLKLFNLSANYQIQTS